MAKQLLTDARRVPTRARNFRKYFKTGTPDSALAEFYSINPSNVRERKTFDFSRNYAFGHVSGFIKSKGKYKNGGFRIDKT